MFDSTELDHSFIIQFGDDVSVDSDIIQYNIEKLVGETMLYHLLEKVSDLNQKRSTDEDEAYVDGMLRMLNGAWSNIFVGRFYIWVTSGNKAVLRYGVTIQRFLGDSFPLRKDVDL